MKITKSKLKQVIREVLKEASIRGTGDVGRSVYARRKADPQWQPTGEYEADPDKPGEVRPILKKQGDEYTDAVRKADQSTGHRRWCMSKALEAFPYRYADIGPNKGKDLNKGKREELVVRCFDLVKAAADKGDMDWWGIQYNLGLVEEGSKIKITKSKLAQIIKEELKESAWPEEQLTQEEQKVIEQIELLVAAIKAMGESNPAMTDEYVSLFRALEEAGLSTANVAKMV